MESKDTSGSVRVVFPLLLRRDGNPRLRQPTVVVSKEREVLVFRRGVSHEVPAWVPDACSLMVKHTGRVAFACYACLTEDR